MASWDHTTRIEYRKIADFDGYLASSIGLIYSWRKRHPRHRPTPFWKPLGQNIHTGGYLAVYLYRDSKRTARFVHRLILEAFVGPCPPGMEACHNDGNRQNNRIDNLRWDTRRNNHADKSKHGTLLKGSKVGNSKLTEDQIPTIRALYADGRFQWEIAEMYNVTPTLISQIVCKRIWKHVE